MKNTHYLAIFSMLLLSSGYLSSCTTNGNRPEAGMGSEEELSQQEVIQKGKYLVGIMGCNDCHSPKRMGPNGPEIIPELMLSGFPADGPVSMLDSQHVQPGFSVFFPDLTAAKGVWGISFAGNLTPDNTGIGTWTEEQFKIALTQGRLKGVASARTLLPPMPWTNYIDLRDEDVHAIFSYLKSIDPVRNIVPAPIPPDAI